MLTKIVRTFRKLLNLHTKNAALSKKSTHLQLSKKMILQAPHHNLAKNKISKNALYVIKDLQKAGYEAYLVGGSVRDLLLGIKPKDFDVATNAKPNQILRFVPKTRLIGARFRLVHAYFRNEVIEISTFRASSGAKTSHTGRILEDNVYGTIEEDAMRRDFTINALYFDPNSGQILDFVGGLEHLKNKELCLIGDPLKRYQEDPVRMLRAVRFLAKLQQFDFKLEPQASSGINIYADYLSSVHKARLYDEVIKLFCTGYGANAYDLLQRDFPNLLLKIFTNVPMFASAQNSDKNLIFRQALQFIDQKKGSVELLFAALFWAQLEFAIRKMPAHLPIAEAIKRASELIFKKHCPNLLVPQKLIYAVNDIWFMQWRLLKRKPKNAFKNIKYLWFKEGLQLFSLREKYVPTTEPLAFWWITFAQADFTKQKEMLNYLSRKSNMANKSNLPKRNKFLRRSKSIEKNKTVKNNA